MPETTTAVTDSDADRKEKASTSGTAPVQTQSTSANKNIEAETYDDDNDSWADQVRELKNKRAYMRRTLTTLENYIKTHDGSARSCDLIKRQLINCTKSIEKYEKLLEDTYDCDFEESFTEYFLDGDAANLKFSTLKVECDGFNIFLDDSKQNTQLNSTFLNPAAPISCGVKLPTLNLPTFDGKIQNWTSFYETFSKSIGSNASLNNVEKLQYLKCALSGEAIEVIKCLEITDANYLTAIRLLRDRFENKRVLLNCHLKALFDIEILTKEVHTGIRHILDTALQHTQSLKALGRPVDQWDDLLNYIILSKLPYNTRKDFETSIDHSNLPTFQQLTQFLTQKCHILGTMQLDVNKTNRNYNTQFKVHSVVVNNKYCHFCKGDQHYLSQCEKYLKLPVLERLEFVRSKRLCHNCLRKGHFTVDCRSSVCTKCHKKHNSTLHFNKVNPSAHVVSTEVEEPATQIKNLENTDNYELKALFSEQISSADVLLSTCIVLVENLRGEFVEVRALLDSGSQVSIITSDLAKKLGLQMMKTNISIVGVNKKLSDSNSIAKLTFKSKLNEFTKTINVFVLESICNNVPSISVKNVKFSVPQNIILADPNFVDSRPIDLLIGNELFFELLSIGQIKLSNGLTLQKSIFGWLVSGKVYREPHALALNCMLTNLEEKISSFWNIENLPEVSYKTAEEQFCEEHFKSTIKRNSEGRFVARLPFKVAPDALGDSFLTAKRCFLHLEKRLCRGDASAQAYYDFMQEFLDLNYMTCLGPIGDHIPDGYYLPHHAVVKADSISTKTRVVFNASAKTNTGYSLNDILAKGPVLQEDLFSILVPFRLFYHVLSADIRKMYPQILIDRLDTKYQRLLFRFSNMEPIQVYELLRLTYGTKSASFIATRCLQQLADDIKDSDPELAKIIEKYFYMDNFMTGSDSISYLIQLRDKISDLFAQAGFQLLQWVSNCRGITADLEKSPVKNLVITCEDNESIKALGMQWLPNSDTIRYSYKAPQIHNKYTKRNILSCIAQVFDPLGMLGPVILYAKLIMQDIWQLKLDWDESLPVHIYSRWIQLAQELGNVCELDIPRKVFRSSTSKLELHAFSDASTKGYGACVYVREIIDADNINCSLLAAKSRVAPLKQVTLPRLELCAALLLSQLVKKIIGCIQREFSSITFYTDSTIVLCWLQCCPSKLHTFVANRVSQIQSNSSIKNWCHVKGSENPADIISRGCMPQQLYENKLWWRGPDFLYAADFRPVPYERDNFDAIPEMKCLLAEQQNNVDDAIYDKLINKFSSFEKLIRVTSYCLRFIANCKTAVRNKTAYLSVDELDKAELVLVRIIQGKYFARELASLEHKGFVDSKSKLLQLSPFLDDNKLIRVGGRLRNSDLPYDNKHSIVLPTSCNFTDSLIHYTHLKTKHIGVLGTLSVVRNKYWILSGKNAVKKVLRKCVKCRIHNPIFKIPIMADLPDSRLKVTRPFATTGVDFFGPFLIKEGSRTSRKIRKVYGCIFVCFLTKAVHCEIVEDLTAEACFIAIRRFVARRGLVTKLYSDNGTNFQGVSNELKELYAVLESHDSDLNEMLAKMRISWHFNPPRAPHFGGLFEAAVKSFKRHFFKIAGNANLTISELYTIMVEIEAIMNSRPITPLSSDPHDYSCITPGHFLIGTDFFSLPEVNWTDHRLNTLSRWQRVQQLQQHFWNRWRQDYLQELQKRQKWNDPRCSKLSVGQMVIIAEDNTPSRMWKLGRVTQLHPGSDGEVRVVTVRTPMGERKRSVARICVLPIDTDTDVRMDSTEEDAEE